MNDENLQPSEQRGGTTPGEQEARDKGQWAAKAAEGVVPAQLGGSDAPREALGQDPQLGSEVLGASTGDERPATERGVRREAGDQADATTHGGAQRPSGHEPDLKDAASGPRAVDH